MAHAEGTPKTVVNITDDKQLWVYVNEFRGKMYMDIRVYEKEYGVYTPTKHGISIPLPAVNQDMGSAIVKGISEGIPAIMAFVQK